MDTLAKSSQNQLNCLLFEFVKKINIPHSVKSFRPYQVPQLTVIRSVVDREDLKSYWGYVAAFFKVINKPIIYKFFKDLTNELLGHEFSRNAGKYEPE